MYPIFPKNKMEKTTIIYNYNENFSSVATAPDSPTCIRRNANAQALLSMFPQCDSDYKSPSEDATDRIELKLILNKLTCLDADVTNNGIDGYNTMYLPYNTSHDLEPLTNFVGRCLNNGTRERDIDLIMNKYETRGIELISSLAKRMKMNPKKAFDRYHELIKSTYSVLNYNCLMRENSLDRPVGPRDPGYLMSHSIAKLAPFNENNM
jgi:hypothetical protein